MNYAYVDNLITLKKSLQAANSESVIGEAVFVLVKVRNYNIRNRRAILGNKMAREGWRHWRKEAFSIPYHSHPPHTHMKQVYLVHPQATVPPSYPRMVE